MFRNLINVLRDDEGATLVEYALLVALIAAACITIITTLGTSISGKFSSVSASI